MRWGTTPRRHPTDCGALRAVKSFFRPAGLTGLYVSEHIQQTQHQKDWHVGAERCHKMQPDCNPDEQPTE